jgi:hypothetical protein
MVFYLLYFFYVIITIFLFYDLIKIHVISRIRVFGTSITSLATIIANNRNSRRINSLVLFRDLLKT